MKHNKKGYAVGDLLPLGITFAVIAIALGIASSVLLSAHEGQDVNSTGYNVSLLGLEALDELASWLPTTAMIIAAIVIIGVIATFLLARFKD